MAKEIVGLRKYSFTDKETQKDVTGFTLHLQWYEEGTEGVCCESASISVSKLQGYVPSLGQEVLVGYNKYKKPDFIVPVVQPAVQAAGK